MVLVTHCLSFFSFSCLEIGYNFNQNGQNICHYYDWCKCSFLECSVSAWMLRLRYSGRIAFTFNWQTKCSFSFWLLFRNHIEIVHTNTNFCIFLLYNDTSLCELVGIAKPREIEKLTSNYKGMQTHKKIEMNYKFTANEPSCDALEIIL